MTAACRSVGRHQQEPTKAGRGLNSGAPPTLSPRYPSHPMDKKVHRSRGEETPGCKEHAGRPLPRGWASVGRQGRLQLLWGRFQGSPKATSLWVGITEQGATTGRGFRKEPLPVGSLHSRR